MATGTTGLAFDDSDEVDMSDWLRDACRAADAGLSVHEMIERTPVGTTFALMDRESTRAHVWRPVHLEVTHAGSGNRWWRLLDVSGLEVIDEPPSCPKDGFAEEQLLADVESSFYSILTEEVRSQLSGRFGEPEHGSGAAPGDSYDEP